MFEIENLPPLFIYNFCLSATIPHQLFSQYEKSAGDKEKEEALISLYVLSQCNLSSSTLYCLASSFCLTSAVVISLFPSQYEESAGDKEKEEALLPSNIYILMQPFFINSLLPPLFH